MPSVTSKKPAIHATAVVSQEALLGEGVVVGPYCIVGPQVRIGKGTQLISHVHIDGITEIGERCKIYPGAAVGFPGQARNLDASARSSVRIGDDNVLRECVTIHAGLKDGSVTTVGSRNLFMAYSHVAHDCVVGDDNTFANSVALAGHVEVGNRVVIGGLVGVHQFVRIGSLSIIGGLTKIVMDAPPFSMYDGHPAIFRGVNAVGLKRAGYSASQIAPIKKLLVELFGGRANTSSILPDLKREYQNNPDAQEIFRFIEKSKRGIGRGVSRYSETD